MNKKITDCLKVIFGGIAFLLVLMFILATIGVALLCALFQNTAGYILISAFGIMLVINAILIIISLSEDDEVEEIDVAESEGK